MFSSKVIDSMCSVYDEETGKGVAYIPAWPRGEEYTFGGRVYRCKLNAGLSKKNEIDEEYVKLGDALMFLSNYYRHNDFGTFPVDKLEEPEYLDDVECEYDISLKELMEIWETYIKDFDATQDREVVLEDSKKRLGGGVCAFDEIIRFNRLCKLMTINAPNVVQSREEYFFTQAFVLNRIGESIEEISFIEEDKSDNSFFDMASEITKADAQGIREMLVSEPKFLKDPKAGYFILMSEVFADPLMAYNVITGDQDKLKKFKEVLQEFTYIDSKKTNTVRTFELMIDKYGLEDGIRKGDSELGVKHYMFQDVLKERVIFDMRRLRIRAGISFNKGD